MAAKSGILSTYSGSIFSIFPFLGRSSISERFCFISLVLGRTRFDGARYQIVLNAHWVRSLGNDSHAFIKWEEFAHLKGHAYCTYWTLYRDEWTKSSVDFVVTLCVRVVCAWVCVFLSGFFVVIFILCSEVCFLFFFLLLCIFCLLVVFFLGGGVAVRIWAFLFVFYLFLFSFL